MCSDDEYCWIKEEELTSSPLRPLSSAGTLTPDSSSVETPVDSDQSSPSKTLTDIHKESSLSLLFPNIVPTSMDLEALTPFSLPSNPIGFEPPHDLSPDLRALVLSYPISKDHEGLEPSSRTASEHEDAKEDTANEKDPNSTGSTLFASHTQPKIFAPFYSMPGHEIGQLDFKPYICNDFDPERIVFPEFPEATSQVLAVLSHLSTVEKNIVEAKGNDSTESKDLRARCKYTFFSVDIPSSNTEDLILASKRKKHRARKVSRRSSHEKHGKVPKTTLGLTEISHATTVLTIVSMIGIVIGGLFSVYEWLSLNSLQAKASESSKTNPPIPVGDLVARASTNRSCVPNVFMSTHASDRPDSPLSVPVSSITTTVLQSVTSTVTQTVTETVWALPTASVPVDDSSSHSTASSIPNDSLRSFSHGIYPKNSISLWLSPLKDTADSSQGTDEESLKYNHSLECHRYHLSILNQHKWTQFIQTYSKGALLKSWIPSQVSTTSRHVWNAFRPNSLSNAISSSLSPIKKELNLKKFLTLSSYLDRPKEIINNFVPSWKSTDRITKPSQSLKMKKKEPKKCKVVRKKATPKDKLLRQTRKLWKKMKGWPSSVTKSFKKLAKSRASWIAPHKGRISSATGNRSTRSSPVVHPWQCAALPPIPSPNQPNAWHTAYQSTVMELFRRGWSNLNPLFDWLIKSKKHLATLNLHWLQDQLATRALHDQYLAWYRRQFQCPVPCVFLEPTPQPGRSQARRSKTSKRVKRRVCSRASREYSNLHTRTKYSVYSQP